MITNLLKTAGLCLTSLTSFLNTPQEQAETTTEDISFYLQEQNRRHNGETNPYLYWATTPSTLANGYVESETASATRTQSGITITTKYVSMSLGFMSEDNAYYLHRYDNQATSFAIQIYKIDFDEQYLYTGQIDEYYTLWNNPANQTETIQIRIYESIDNAKAQRWLDTDIQTLVQNDPQAPIGIYRDLISNNNISIWGQIANNQVETNSEEIYTYNTEITPTYTKSLYVLCWTQNIPDNGFTEGEDDTPQFYVTGTEGALFSFVKTTPQQALYMEVVDVPNIMFTILGMPFTFMSIAFNLTLFKGTPYQINISALFLAILGILIMMWLITFIAGKLK